MALLAAASLWLYARLARQVGAMAVANDDRHLHTGQIPSGAGVAFLWPLVVLFFLLGGDVLTTGPENSNPRELLLLTGGGLLLLLGLGYADDRTPLPARYRLLVQVLLMTLAITISTPMLSWLGVGWLGVIFVGGLWWLNLFNFMDGANGMAAGHAIVATVFYAVAFCLADQTDMALLATATTVASAVFLRWNFPHARLFMGDAGSLGLGWVMLMLALLGFSLRAFDPAFVLTLHAPFVLDASLTLLQRWQAGRPLTQAHREHLYQRLIAVGWSHARVAVVYALATVASGMLALANQTMDAPQRWLLAGCWLLTLLLLGSFLNQTTKNQPAA